MDLSILIPARNEMFLARTIQDILENIEADTEVIAFMDGEWADPPVPQHDRVKVVHSGTAVGQRQGTNLACRISDAKYVMKVDAHCSFDKGFDRKMLEAFKVSGDEVTMVPIMRNLWAFDWKCRKCGSRWYQGPTPTQCMRKATKEERARKLPGTLPNEGCDETKNFRRKITWIGKERPQSTSYCFDPEPHFQYFREYEKRPEYKEARDSVGLTETMSLQGSCFMLTRENYWKWNISDETVGNWGNQGIEVACKTWLQGGRVLCNHSTWYAHMFRTQGGDFGFPWPASGREAQQTKLNVKNQIWGSKLAHQKYPIKWLVEKFWPVPGWEQADLDALSQN